VFGGKFRAGLQKLKKDGKLEFHGKLQALEEPARFGKLLHKLKTQKFVVYARRPFAGPEAVLKYLSRYTHRVAIGNRRLLALDERSVTFSYKDYADESRRKTMTLLIEEFTRRFCLHLLPERFVKIGITDYWAIADGRNELRGRGKAWESKKRRWLKPGRPGTFNLQASTQTKVCAVRIVGRWRWCGWRKCRGD
jgi:hypothetical protein